MQYLAVNSQQKSSEIVSWYIRAVDSSLTYIWSHWCIFTIPLQCVLAERAEFCLVFSSVEN